MNPPLVIGHRGAPRAEPENTLPSFLAASTEGADWIELDVHLTSDGAVVVVHDPTYDDGRLACDTPAADRPATVPLLDDVLDACGGAGLGVNIEIKACPGEADHHTAGPLTDAVLATLDGRGDDGTRQADRLLVTSFWPDTIARVRERSDVPTGWLTVHVGDDVDAFLDRVADGGHQALNPWDALVDADLIDAAHQRRLQVNVWTVNDADRIRSLAAWGVDGIITDEPGVARSLLA
jgi:glycerophosphoryl diester phosphodiesterase